MRWMICWNQQGCEGAKNYEDVAGVAGEIAAVADQHSALAMDWFRSAKPGDVLEFPLGIVVRTSEHATEIGYDREEETGS